MIAQIRGEVAEILPASVIIDTGSIGYEVQISEIDKETISTGSSVKLYTYFHVRENSQDLFGFSSITSKQLFEKLLSVNGVGPKGALAIMSLGTEAQIKDAISSENIAYLTGASGIGKKAAERIAVDLKDKVGYFTESTTLSQKNRDDALDALVALGYSQSQSAEALMSIKSELPTEDRVKHALKELSR